jgi:2-amino-4-hydroxy-6-hydroxymethyldihydropteridine diphosphokinase
MIAHLCLGANIGDPADQIETAIQHLRNSGIRIIRRSSLIHTKPYGLKEQPDYLNQVIEVRCDLSPRELLRKIQDAEASMGRIRTLRWGPRLIDIDILLCEDQVVNDIDLVVPHPDFTNRLFALQLLDELVPDLFHPVLKKPIHDIYESLKKSGGHR